MRARKNYIDYLDDDELDLPDSFEAFKKTERITQVKRTPKKSHDTENSRKVRKQLGKDGIQRRRLRKME